jgi:hypothetical protein
MISLLVNVLILLIVCGIIWYIISLLPLPAPFKNIAMIVFALIILLVLLSEIGFLGGPIGGRPLLR